MKGLNIFFFPSFFIAVENYMFSHRWIFESSKYFSFFIFLSLLPYKHIHVFFHIVRQLTGLNIFFFHLSSFFLCHCRKLHVFHKLGQLEDRNIFYFLIFFVAVEDYMCFHIVGQSKCLNISFFIFLSLFIAVDSYICFHIVRQLKGLNTFYCLFLCLCR